jgi:spermidine synthase
MGAAVLLQCPATLPSARGGAVLVALILTVVAWSRTPADVNEALNVGYIPKGHTVLHVREGIEGTVVVSEPADEVAGTNRVLWINRVQATTSIEKGVKMNRLQGVLPLLFNRDPKDVLFMCFGSGITCGTLALSDFARIDAVEISPDVLAVAPAFNSDNLGVIDRPEVKFHIDDGRNFLLTTTHRYDVITFEPMPLAMAGVSTFYTKDYYELCLEHLSPGGIVSQWVPLHSLNPKVVRSLVYTFTTVFPEYQAWFVNADLFLIGSNQPLFIDVEGFRAHLENPVLMDALQQVGLPDLEEIVAAFLLDKAGVDAYAAGGEVMTDDRPWAEFIAPKLVYARTQHESMKEFAPHVATTLPLAHRDSLPPTLVAGLERRHAAHRHDLKGLQAYYGGMVLDNTAYDAFAESLVIDPKNYNARYYLKQIAVGKARLQIDWEEYDKAEALTRDALGYLGNDAELQGLLDQAIRHQH